MIVARGLKVVYIRTIDVQRLQGDQVARFVRIDQCRPMPVGNELLIDMHGRKADKVTLTDMRIAVVHDHIDVVLLDIEGKIGELTTVFHVLYPHLFECSIIPGVGNEMEMTKSLLPVKLAFE